MNDIDALLSRMYHPGLKAIEPGLERVERFLTLLGSPQKRLPPVIHVAGTNGKGSLIACLHAIFEAAGYTVHRYTSPHLVRFNERIVLNGKPIGDDYLRQLLERVVGPIDTQPVTFFEATTAAAFLAFSEHPADILLLEVGMGGKLDATNVVGNPVLTAITPVSLDHQNFLGETVAEIAAEKAGIVKKGVPCVVGRQAPKAAHVIAHYAETQSAPLYRCDYDWQLLPRGGHIVFQSPERILTIKPVLEGAHQFDNAATAVACIDKLPQFAIGDASIVHGLAHAVWPGRLQHLTRGRYARLLPKGMELWLDGGHNRHGGEVLGRWLKDHNNKEAHIICGMVKGKETGAYLKELAPYVKSLHAVAIAGEPLSQPAEQVLMAAKEAGIKAASSASVENALQTIARHAKTPAIVCICGSLYLAGKVLAANE